MNIIRPEFVPVIIGGIYLVALLILKKISVSRILLSLLVLLSLTPINIVTYTYVFSAVYVTQALILLKQKERLVAYKYFLLAFLATVTCLDPVLPHYKITLLIVALIQILFASEKIEGQNNYLYLANLTLLAGLVMKLQPVQDNNLTSFIIIAALLVLCLRTLLLNISTVLTLLPIFILGSVCSQTMLLVALFLYSIYASLLINSKNHRLSLVILLILPFIDGSIFSTTLLDIFGKNNVLDIFYLSLSAAILLSLCIAKLLEIQFKQGKLSFNYKTILIVFFPTVLMSIKIIEGGSPFVSLPVPLLAAIPLVILEARYLSLLSRINLQFALGSTDLMNYCFRWINTAPKTVYIKRPKHLARTVTSYIDTKVLKQDYTVFLAVTTLIMTIIIFLYMEVL